MNEKPNETPAADPRATGEVLIGDVRPKALSALNGLLVRGVPNPQHQMQVAVGLAAIVAMRLMDSMGVFDRGRRTKITKAIEAEFSTRLRATIAANLADRAAARAKAPAPANDDVKAPLTTAPDPAGL
jgi:hypothetical protein